MGWSNVDPADHHKETAQHEDAVTYTYYKYYIHSLTGCPSSPTAIENHWTMTVHDWAVCCTAASWILSMLESSTASSVGLPPKQLYGNSCSMCPVWSSGGSGWWGHCCPRSPRFICCLRHCQSQHFVLTSGTDLWTKWSSFIMVPIVPAWSFPVGIHGSSSVQLVCGVPQGSVCGPILFIMYTVDLIALVERHGLCPHLYMADMQIYGSCPPSAVHDLQQYLSACMDDVHFWMQSNRLQLNTNKTELLWCTTARCQHQLPRSAFRIGSADIIPTTAVRDLGIYIDADLSMRSHIQQTVAGCFTILWQLCSVQRSVPSSVLQTLVVALVLTRLDYGMPPCLVFLLTSSTVYSLCSTPQRGQSLVFVGRLTLQTLLPVFIGYELPSESSSNWQLLSTELFTALHLNICRTCRDALPTSHPAVVSSRQLPATSLYAHHA